MTWYLKNRGAGVVTAVAIVTLLLLFSPLAAASVRPSPAGVTIALAAFVAIALPTAISWGCSRASAVLDASAARMIETYDLGFALAAALLTVICSLSFEALGMTSVGFVAARDTITYLGMALMVVPIVGWTRAATVPAAYLLAVGVFGRGSDYFSPAPWAWIAAGPSEPAPWAAAGVVLVAGMASYVLLPRFVRRHEPIRSSVQD